MSKRGIILRSLVASVEASVASPRRFPRARGLRLAEQSRALAVHVTSTSPRRCTFRASRRRPDRTGLYPGRLACVIDDSILRGVAAGPRWLPPPRRRRGSAVAPSPTASPRVRGGSPPPASPRVRGRDRFRATHRPSVVWQIKVVPSMADKSRARAVDIRRQRRQVSKACRGQQKDVWQTQRRVESTSVPKCAAVVGVLQARRGAEGLAGMREHVNGRDASLLVGAPRVRVPVRKSLLRTRVPKFPS